MKTNSIFKMALGSLVGLAFAACADEVAYTPAPQEDASKTYVKVDETTPRNLDVDGADIVVPLVRTNAAGAMDVTVALQDTSGVFALKSTTVSFADGETVANAVVTYSYDALDPAAEYAISVGLADESVASQYTAITIPMTCKKAWQNLGMAQWYDDWWVGGPFEKQLLKAPDGSETYRLINPWDKQSVEDGGLTFSNEVPYLEFVINEDGTISYSTLLNMGFTYSGMTCHNLHPAGMKDDANAAKNAMVMENVARFCWYPILNYNASTGGFSWWGTTAVAFISFPGGPDLAELLGL